MNRHKYTDRIVYTRTCEEMHALYPNGQPLYASTNGYFPAKWDEDFNCVMLPDGASVFRAATFCPHCGAAIVRYYCDCAAAQDALGVQKYGEQFAAECATARSQRHEPAEEQKFLRLMAQRGVKA